MPKKRKKFDIPAGSSITAEEVCSIKVKQEKEATGEPMKVSNKGLKRKNEIAGNTPKCRKKLTVQCDGKTAIKNDCDMEN